jgi:hypothetical protein
MPIDRRKPKRSEETDSPWRRWLTLGLCSLSVAAVVLFLYSEFWVNSATVWLLVPEHGATWIRRERPFRIDAWGGTEEIVVFQKRLRLPPHSGPHRLTVRALRSCEVFWDHGSLYSVPPQDQDWTEAHQIALPDDVPGEHSLAISVKNALGPAALLAYSDSLDVRTGLDWQEWDGKAWQPVTTLDHVELDKSVRRFPSSWHALATTLWWLGPLFLAVFAVGLWATRGGDVRAPWTKLWSASRCRWIVIAAWLVLAANNFLKLPRDMGYDAPAHVDYIHFVAERGTLPDASDGWQMFQAPLFYMMGAAVYRGLTLVTAAGTAALWLRWLTLFCGVAQVELCYRAGRLVFPDRDDLQSLAVLFGGLLPMNVYMSQTLSNEPLCGVFSALIVLLCWQMLREPEAALKPGRQLLLGLVFGLALLTKTTAVLLGPLIVVVLGFTLWPQGRRALLTAAARCFGAAVVVSGWYYGLNWMRHGQFFVGGWDASRGLLWWQDPGYRTPSQMLSFGRALGQPMYSGFYSIWDGFYATLWLDANLGGLDSATAIPWHLSLLLSASFLGLVLSALIAAGFVRGLGCHDVGLRKSLLLSDGILLLYLAAYTVLALRVPIFSQAKASYTLGLTPVYAVLCVAGFDLLPKSRPLRSAANAFIICWSLLVYATYFAR